MRRSTRWRSSCGFPGKLGMDGSQVYAAYLDGKLDDIRRYCETDVMNTYLLYCRFQKMPRPASTKPAMLRESRAGARHGWRAIDEPHWAEYLATWPAQAALQRPRAARAGDVPPIRDLASPDDAPRPDDVPAADPADDE